MNAGILLVILGIYPLCFLTAYKIDVTSQRLNLSVGFKKPRPILLRPLLSLYAPALKPWRIAKDNLLPSKPHDVIYEQSLKLLINTLVTVRQIHFLTMFDCTFLAGVNEACWLSQSSI